ncbi:MAG: DUF393 domain-containing protein [Bacteroidetes bacterium]|nr:DUF393 domain-containing protein [Bacteroidota bacterium]MBS1541273.1 DUF393 domain-containing protein [Bacteroidota bacterium]
MGSPDPIRKIVLFDGACIFCLASVHFLLRHNEKGNLRFATQQPKYSESQDALFSNIHRGDTIVYVSGEDVFVRSDAVLEICRELNGFYPALYVLKIIPRPVRNWVYDFIARHRYAWFGKKEKCLLPTAELALRFID